MPLASGQRVRRLDRRADDAARPRQHHHAADLRSTTGQAAHDLIASRNSLTSLYVNANAPGALVENAVDLVNISNTGASTVTYMGRGPYEHAE